MQSRITATARRVEHNHSRGEMEEMAEALSEFQATWMERVTQQEPRPLSLVEGGTAGLDLVARYDGEIGRGALTIVVFVHGSG